MTCLFVLIGKSQHWWRHPVHLLRWFRTCHETPSWSLFRAVYADIRQSFARFWWIRYCAICRPSPQIPCFNPILFSPRNSVQWRVKSDEIQCAMSIRERWILLYIYRVVVSVVQQSYTKSFLSFGELNRTSSLVAPRTHRISDKWSLTSVFYQTGPFAPIIT